LGTITYYIIIFAIGITIDILTKQKNMESKKGLNWFFILIAFTLGLTLIKHINFKNFTLKEPALDILYIIVFLISIYIIIMDLKKSKEKEK
jgi:NhaP-type Na+/H+ and K+/H+ antiporter